MSIVFLWQKHLQNQYKNIECIEVSPILDECNLFLERTPLMLSQHSRSQALVKEEVCDRRGEPTLNLAILMEMKPKSMPEP